MATEKIVTSVEDVQKFLLENGISEKRVQRAIRIKSTMPTAGIFAAISTNTFVNEDKESIKYPVFVIHDKAGAGGQKIGEISLAQVIQDISAGKARQIKNSPVSSRIGKYFHIGKPLSELKGASEAEIIVELMGKAFTTEEVRNCVVPSFRKDDNGDIIFYNTAEEALAAFDNKDCTKFIVKYKK